jgi:YD repeat-containing protein
MRKHLFFVLAAVITLASCKKDRDDNDGGDGNNPPPANAKLLKKLTEVDDGVTTVYNLTYDNNKRLTSVKTSDNSDITNINYDGSGNVVRIESIQEDVRNLYEFTYTNNKPVSGTFKSWERNGTDPEVLTQDDILTYTVENNRVTKMVMEMTIQEQEIPFVYEYDNNGNVTKIQTENSGAYVATFSYGNKKSPFPKMFNYVLDQAGYSLRFFAKNEMKAISFDFPGTQLDNAITVQYTYDAEGYPLTSTDGTTQNTYEYQ